jgi:hypothetical protein
LDTLSSGVRAAASPSSRYPWEVSKALPIAIGVDYAVGSSIALLVSDQISHC